MKSLLFAIGVLLLSSCSTGPSLQMSYGDASMETGPTSVEDGRMRHRQFYLDHDDSPGWMKIVPQNNR
jgi:hypothetical protein